MNDLSLIFFYPFKEKIVFKTHQIKSDHRVLGKNGAPVFAPDYSATVLAVKMWTNSNEHSLYVRFLWLEPFQVEALKGRLVTLATNIWSSDCRHKRTGLQHKGINYNCKKFNSISPGVVRGTVSNVRQRGDKKRKLDIQGKDRDWKVRNGKISYLVQLD
jgi:hypothetical protein